METTPLFSQLGGFLSNAEPNSGLELHISLDPSKTSLRVDVQLLSPDGSRTLHGVAVSGPAEVLDARFAELIMEPLGKGAEKASLDRFNSGLDAIIAQRRKEKEAEKAQQEKREAAKGKRKTMDKPAPPQSDFERCWTLGVEAKNAGDYVVARRWFNDALCHADTENRKERCREKIFAMEKLMGA